MIMFNKTTLALATLLGTSTGFYTQAETTIPGNAAATCSVSHGQLANWFAGRSIHTDGWVNPADSTDKKFNPSNDPTTCDFYQWGA